MHPAQVLDYQADLYERAMQTRFQSIVADHYRLDRKVYIGDQAARLEGDRISKIMHNAFQVASAYYVDPDMTDLVVYSSTGMDESDVFRYDELPTECGFAYFEKPLILHDVRGVDLLINGLLWFSTINVDHTGQQKSGTMLMLLNDHARTPDTIAREIMGQHRTGFDYDVYRAVLGTWGLIGFEMLYDGQQIGPEVVTADYEKIAELENAGLIAHEFTNIRRQVHAFWLMLNQTITKVTDSEIPRPYARRAKRAKLPARVTVVRLRRHENHNQGVGKTSVEWQHTWLVRGHWRWQPVSEHHPLAEGDGEGGYHARLWVRGHVKGPEGKPLHIPTKVYHLTE